MASDTPSITPEIKERATMMSAFNSKSLLIAIGPQKVLFSVHEAKLGRTSFFTVHDPLTAEQRSQFMATRPEGLQQNIGQGIRQSVNPRVQTIKLEDGSLQDVRLAVPDYHIKDQFFLKPAAFDVFVKFLYNEPPALPKNRVEVKILLQAYGIAKNYNCFDLQNKILDNFRAYHARTHIKLEDLIWTANRFDDKIGCRLTAYFVEQVAFEIADRGYGAFEASNLFLGTFLEEGDRKIRGDLFQAISHYAHKGLDQDPATGQKKFHVDATGEPVDGPQE